MTDSLHKRRVRKVLITGASSGIGFQAAKRILAAGNKIIIPCRDEKTSHNTLNRIRNGINPGFNVEDYVDAPIMDLSDLISIRNFIRYIVDMGKPIDVLILNAGLQYTGSPKPRFSKQGYELTFAVNHLANQYLVTSLQKLLLKGNEPRLIITSSEVHNPQSSGGQIGKLAGLGNLIGLQSEKFLMLDGSSDFNADKAYKDSKLCNILLAREFAQRLKLNNYVIPVIAWAPGLIIPRNNNGFFRYSRQYGEFKQRLFAFLARDVFRIAETPEHAGKLLKDLCIENKYSKPGFQYYSNRIVGLGKKLFDSCEISDEASNVKLAKDLWDSSEVLLEKITSNN